MIDDLGRHKRTRFTREERVVDKALRSPFFDNLEEISGSYEIKEFKRTVMIKRPYQCGLFVCLFNLFNVGVRIYKVYNI